LLVGKAYTAMLDLKPGDEFEIKLGRKQIRLVPSVGLIQSPSQVPLLGLSAWAEVGGIASSLCSKAFLPQPIST